MYVWYMYMIILSEFLNFTIYHSNNLSINPYTTILKSFPSCVISPSRETIPNQVRIGIRRTEEQRRIKNKELYLHGAKIRHVSVAHSTRNRLSLTTKRTPAWAWAPATVSNGNKCHVSAIKCVKMLIRPEHTATATAEEITTTRMATTSGETAKTKRMKERKEQKPQNRSTTRLLDAFTHFPLTFLLYANFKPEKCTFILSLYLLILIRRWGEAVPP